jgi:cytoskeletal protein CcmA (bactofilin family)
MFKKSEESEWTRFSRALGGTQPAPGQREESVPSDEGDDQDPVTMSQPVPADVTMTSATREDPEDLPDLTRAVEMPRPEASEHVAAPPQAAAPGYPPTGHAQSLESGETIIGAGATIDGNVRSDQSIRILGTVQGEVETQRRVIVGEGARVQARIAAEHVTVLGEVNGAIECSGRVEIAASGRVSGEVTAGTLVIQEGAFFEGHLKMSSGQIETTP